MKSWPSKALLLAGATSLLVAIPASGQDPESLLPPGFGDPKSLPPPEEKAPPPPPRTPSRTPVERSPALQESANPDEDVELSELDRPRPTNYFSIPEGEARPVETVGPLVPGNYGLPAAAFGRTNGGFLLTLRPDHATHCCRNASLIGQRRLSRQQDPGFG